MTSHKSAKKRKQGERVYLEPEPKLRLPKPQSECSTPELASGMPRELLSALRKLNRKRKAGADDDTPAAS